ncbi:MAG: Mg-chelatase subunit ChlD [Acidobacteria bacterium]|nr:Mg-chelatase subunit ChlD [Acidobacteriota bacterium]
MTLHRVPRSNRRRAADALAASLLLALLTTQTAAANTTQLLLTRDREHADAAEYKGLVDLSVNPGFDDARVTITLDGQKLTDALRAPYRLTVDFGPIAVQHRIVVTAWSRDKNRVQWSETINRGLLPLSVKLKAVDAAAGIFEATVTAPKEDPIAAVELWDEGKLNASITEPPYRFTVASAAGRSDAFVQVTAKTKSGEEAADFWSSAGEVHVESVNVREVPLFVSVIDRDGVTRDDVDRSLFRIIDNDSEAKIVEFGKAFDQPISIALLLDASASMTYTMHAAIAAAQSFVQKTLRPNDRCALFAIRDVPRRVQEMTNDRLAVERALKNVQPMGRTSLYDAIESALRELKDEKNRRAVVVLTDGGDTTSLASFDEVEKDAKQAGIPIYVIAYTVEGVPLDTQDFERMKFLTSETGGFVAVASNEQNLQARYGEIEKDLRAQFAIRYQVTDYAKRNEWRKVRVVLASPRLTARTIRGYFAP